MELAASDDSFAWSDASDDSDMALNIKQEKSDDESEKSYKKKLQEKLFQDESIEQPKKSKKRKHDNSSELNGTENFKNKTIKSEPESDFEIPKKKKRKHSEVVAKVETAEPDESYLNYRVKLEQESFVEPAPVKSKKKKKHKRESEHTANDDNLESSTDATIESSHAEDTLNVSEVEQKEKKKKKKDKQLSITKNSIANSDDDFQEPKEAKSKKREKQSKIYHDTSEVSQVEEISCIESSVLNSHHLDDTTETGNSHVDNVSTNLETTLVNGHQSPKVHSGKEILKISDRLRFEDDTIDYDPEKHLKKTETPNNLQKFHAGNKHLSVIPPNIKAESFLTEDDEIWIIKAPHELNINDFKDVNIKLDSKGKLKSNGQTYDTLVDNSIQKVPILSYVNNKLYIQNVQVEGTINLRKRIPKPHIPEENVMVNYQPSFIPLPETKCRHPLFGINYKKAIKIPPSVAERLSNAETTPHENTIKEKKKKHKKEKRKLEVESESEIKQVNEEVEVRPKKKRKKSSTDEPVAKKAKRIKREPDSAEAWESEQAIEKNLFDF